MQILNKWKSQNDSNKLKIILIEVQFFLETFFEIKLFNCMNYL